VFLDGGILEHKIRVQCNLAEELLDFIGDQKDF
jgi:hypothetical protein